jgi:hypothetical protein
VSTQTICKGGERCEYRASLPKSRSIEIASGKNGLPSVTDAPTVAKPEFRHWHHGRLNWLVAAASFLNEFIRIERPCRYRENIAAGRVR